jgi:hypothetical protein
MRAARPVFLLVSLVVGLPFTSAADTDPLVVEYEGTILEVSEAPPEFVVGNRISGRLLIDRLLADGTDLTLNHATYRSSNPAFVSGFWPSAGDGFDEVSIAKDVSRQGDSGLIDLFSAEDFFVVQNGSLDGARVFSIDAGVRGFLDDVSLEQDFELTAADADEPEEFLSGRIRWSSLGPFPFVSFLIDRLKVKPGRCSAP